MSTTSLTTKGTLESVSHGAGLDELRKRYQAVRSFTERLVEPLSPEDCAAQSMTEASPAKWHLAHTTWFFETFLLAAINEGYQPYDPQFRYLFNSYYNSVGERHPRSQRGLLTRPSLSEVMGYRQEIDRRIGTLFEMASPSINADVLELGLQHEQQHQELVLTDIKHLFGQNPLRPAYRSQPPRASRPPAEPTWIAFPEGIVTIGHRGAGFHFDNESPAHRVFLERFSLQQRLVTNGEYLAFMEDDGYRQPQFWLSEGWDAVCQQGWNAPLYWEKGAQEWRTLTLGGLVPLDPNEPVCHVSYYEADAYARWAGRRLPSEAEWEAAAQTLPIAGNFVESGHLRPIASPGDSAGLQQMFGDVWEWTASAYSAYPGYLPARGALGEYNGKFMCNQFVLRGGSCVTPQMHLRATYRNFFPPEARWQFSGIRLASSD